MTYKMQALLWVVFPTGISSHPVNLLHPVELQQKPGTLQRVSLIERVGAGLIGLFFLIYLIDISLGTGTMPSSRNLSSESQPVSQAVFPPWELRLITAFSNPPAPQHRPAP